MRSAAGDHAVVHVIGRARRTADNGLITRPTSPLSFCFLMEDKEGETTWVLYEQPMPADIVHSEEVVVVGRYANAVRGSFFLAQKILLKCPSKYESNRSTPKSTITRAVSTAEVHLP